MSAWRQSRRHTDTVHQGDLDGIKDVYHIKGQESDSVISASRPEALSDHRDAAR
jgi:hypothetical protein